MLTNELLVNIEKRAREYIAKYGDEDPNGLNEGPPTPGQVVDMVNELLQLRSKAAPAPKKTVKKVVTKKIVKKIAKKPAKKPAKKK